MHFYDKQGNPKYSETIKSAKEKGYFTSTTTINSVEANIGLEIYKINQAILSALTLPRINGETEDDFVKRVKLDMKQHAKKAAKLGSVIHKLIERYLLRKPIFYLGQSVEVLAIFQGLKTWIDNNIEKSDKLEIENVFINYNAEYGCKADLVIYHDDDTITIIDWKTQSIKPQRPWKNNPDKLTKADVNYYDSWCDQLVSIAETDNLKYKNLRSIKSVVASTHPDNLGSVYEKEWTLEPDEYQKGKARFFAKRALFKAKHGL